MDLSMERAALGVGVGFGVFGKDWEGKGREGKGREGKEVNTAFV